jgi:hypothetical protein
MTPSQFDKVMDLKDDEFNADLKSNLGAARSNHVISRATGNAAASNIGSDIKNLSIDDLKVLDFQSQVIDNAKHIQATQLEDMKKDNLFKGDRYQAVKDAHEAALNNETMANIISTRKGDVNIAKLPERILEKVDANGINEFAKHLVATKSWNNSLLTKIANRDDLSGAVKKDIGQSIIHGVSGGNGLNYANFPPELKRFFESGPGVQMR